jgi:hypothetical protein
MDPALFLSQHKNWRKVIWNYDQESMELYVRFCGEGRVSTIRSFPNRYSNWDVPLFTSFTMLGSLSGTSLDLCAMKLREIFEQSGIACGQLCDILCDENDQTRSSKTQLIHLICSVIDLSEFFWETGQIFSPAEKDDLEKISRNFGLCGTIQPGLRAIIESETVLCRIKETLYPILDQALEPLGFHGKQTGAGASVEAVNQCIRDLFYEIGIKSEELAVRHEDAIHLFLPDAYQSYDKNDGKASSDGILSIRDFNALADEQSVLDDPYGRVAGFIAAMDCGIMGARVQSSICGDMEYALCKAGEMATAYGPERLAVAIPAFELLE